MDTAASNSLRTGTFKLHPPFIVLCTWVFLNVLYRFVLIFNKFWFSSLLVGVRGTGWYEKFTARGSKFVLPHWGLEWALKPVMYSVGNVPGSIPGHLH